MLILDLKRVCCPNNKKGVKSVLNFYALKQIVNKTIDSLIPEGMVTNNLFKK